MVVRTALLAASFAAASALLAPAVSAQEYPNRPIRLIVPFGPGGGSDYVGRLVAQKLTEQMGQTVVVDNRAGAASLVGTEIVARAAPDGYTLLLGSASALTVSPVLYKNLPYDPVKSFVPVIQMLRGPFILAVRSDLPVADLKELIEYAKQNKGRLNYGSSGNGSLHHLCAEMLKSAAGIEMTHVPYKGSPQSWAGLNGGEVELICDSMPGPLATLRSGRARAIAVTGEQRASILPAAATFREQGFPEIDIVFWYGILAPAGTPKPIVDRLNAALSAAFKEQDLIARYAQQGIEMFAGTAESFGSLIAGEAQQWRRIVSKLGISVD